MRLPISARRLAALPLLVAALFVACGGPPAPGPSSPGAPAAKHGPIRVGSKDFTEQFIVGEMYALMLEGAGLQVERKLNLGGTPVAHAALVGGQIDLYPEYTGTGMLTVLKTSTSGDRDAVYLAVATQYEDKFNLVWLNPSPMNNTQALAMTRAGAERLGIKTISDMAAKAGELTMIGPPEFEEREDGLPGLRRFYGDFKLKKYVAVDAGLKYEGLKSGQGDVAVAFGTDGEIGALDLVVLEDDKHLFPPYQIAPVVRAEVLAAEPRVRAVLDALAPKLTDETMRRLNYEVSGKKREPADVAREFLVSENLIK